MENQNPSEEIVMYPSVSKPVLLLKYLQCMS